MNGWRRRAYSPIVRPRISRHDLVGAAADRAQARVARGALDPVLDHVAGAAVDLQARVGDVERGALREELRLGHLAQRVLAADEEAQRVVGQRAARLDQRRHLGELVADHLEAADRAPERLALAGVAQRLLEAVLAPRRPRRAPSTSRSHWKLAMMSLKPPCELAEQVLLRDEHVVERDQRGVGRVPAELLDLRGLVAGLVGVDEEERDAAVAALGRRLRGEHDEVRAHAVRDEHLRAVEDPAAVDAPAPSCACRRRRSRRRAR